MRVSKYPEWALHNKVDLVVKGEPDLEVDLAVRVDSVRNVTLGHNRHLEGRASKWVDHRALTHRNNPSEGASFAIK
jgi:hypothetical protein